MGKYKEIKKISLSSLNNAEYVDLMTGFCRLAFPPATVDEEDPDDGGSPGTVSLLAAKAAEGNAELGISAEEQEAFEADLARLADMVENAPKAADETAELKTNDERRDELVVYLTTTVRQQRNSPIQAIRDAANSLYNVVKPYIGIYDIPVRQETVKIDGMLIDLEKEDYPEKLATLGLTPVTVELREVNNRYRELSERRRDKKAANEKEQSAVIRLRLDDLYKDMTTIAFVQSVAHPTEETAAFISQLNTLIDETTNAYKTRVGIAEAEKKKEEEENNQAETK